MKNNKQSDNDYQKYIKTDDLGDTYFDEAQAISEILADEIKKSEYVINIATVCHQANKTWCEINGDFSQKDWDDAEEWQIRSVIKGVYFKLDNPNSSPDAQHNSWMEEKIAQGWIFGDIKDSEKKTHPCIVPFDQLPLFQQQKYMLFSSIVNVLKRK